MTTIRYDRIPTLKIQLSGQENFSSWSAIVKSDFRLFKVLTIALGQDTQPLPHTKSAYIADKGKTEASESDADPSLFRIEQIQDDLADREAHDEYEENMVAQVEADIESWVERNQWGCNYLYHNIEPEIVPIISPYENLSDMWKAILDTYDRRTPTTLLNLVKTINRLEYDDTTPLKTHIQTFEQLWMQLSERTSLIELGDKLAEVYGMMASSHALKAQYLLMSLPSSFDSIVDNLQTKSKLSYQDVYEHLMNIATKQNSGKVDKTAYTVKAAGNPPKKIEGRFCTFCTKRNNGIPVTSHDHRSCFKLKKIKAERKKQSEGKEANIVQATCFYMSYLDPILDVNDKSHVPYPEYKITPTIALVSTTEPNHTSTKWIFDTGATDHISGNRSLFTSLRPLSGNVTTAGGSSLPILGTGTVEVMAKLPDGSLSLLSLENVLYVSGSHFNLLSWKRISTKGFSMSGTNKDIKVQKDGKVFAWAQQDTIGNFILVQQHSAAATAISFRQWHQRLGHLPSSSLPLLKDSVADPECLPKIGSLETCVNCQLGKSTALPYTSSSSRSKDILELVHSDLSGKFTQASLGGMHYYISFIDDFSRMSFVYFLKNKSDAHEALRIFVTMVETQTGKKVKKLRTDNGGEYINKSTSNFLSDKGIMHETTAPYAHSSNGVAERFNRTIATMARTVVLDKGKFLWAEAIAAMCYTKNRIPHKFVQKTPFEAFFGQKPKIGHLKSFGEKCFVHVDVETRATDSKLSARAKEGIFVGYTGANNVYRIYIPSEKGYQPTEMYAFQNQPYPKT